VNCRHHSADKQVARFVNAGRIDEHDLAIGPRYDTLDLESRGLRLI